MVSCWQAHISPLEGRDNVMEAHAHISAVHLLAGAAFVVAVLGTVHLLSLTHDNRFSRAFVTLGF